MVYGLVPDDITIWSDPNWAVAGGGKVSIYVTVENATLGGAISDATVKAVVEDSFMGKIQSAAQKTKNGVPSQPFTFTPSTRSGMAVIRFTVDYTYNKIDYHVEKDYLQPIDHATPFVLNYLEKNATVPTGTLTDLIVQYSDAYGNPIDSRYEDASPSALIPEQVTFSDSVDGDGGFWDGSRYVNSITVFVNDTGYAAVQYKVATVSGDNTISIRGPALVSPSVTYVTIKGVGTAPSAILSTLTPFTGTAYANNEDTISLLYTVLDSCGNPVPGIAIWRNTSLGESERFVTNSEGKIVTRYGPKKDIMQVNITAMVDGNPEISIVNTVRFVQTEAVMWEISASPQMLPSREVNPTISADIRAKVMDSLGNPREGETVTFSIIGYTNSTILTAPPALVIPTAVTDRDGYAIVQFLPGAFPVDGAAFDENATGTALVGASWNGMSKTISITYRNYPYLRVETEVSPMTIQVNDTIEVTVRVIGDGYSLISKPIDVVLVTDRSGSMLYDTPDRMYSVREAAKQFIDEMTPRDRVGLVSFGMSGSISRPGVNSRISTSEINNAYHYPTSYSAYATLDQALSIDLSGAKTKLDYMVPDYGTPMREAVRLSISHEITNARTNAVKAIILLSDGDYNFYGDPLARGTGSTSSTPSDFTDLTTKYYQYTYLNASNQNMSAYAKNNNIKIYAIGFAADISNGGKNTLRILAESTGGKYYDGNAANIETIYKNIAGELKNSAAALNTEMVLDFESLNVTYNEITTLVPGKDVFSYQYVEGISTKITSWNTTINPLPDHVPSYPYTVDQTTGWDQNPPQLKFSIGNISINQTWQATFLLQAKQPGNIDIFGSNSSVTFFGATMKYHVPIPASYATVLGEFIAEDNHPYFLSLDGLPSSGEICMGSQDLEYRWVLNYSGDRAVVQEIYYQRSENGQIWAGDWIHHSTVDAGTGPVNGTVFGVQLDTRDRIGYYKVKVVAKEDCTGGLEAEWVASPSHIKTCGSIRIS